MKPNGAASEQSQTIDFLDKERQKQQQQLATLIEKVNVLASENVEQAKRIRELESEVTKSNTLAPRISAFETSFEQVRSEVVKQIDLMEKRQNESEREQDRYRSTEREGMNRMLAETRKMMDAIPKIEQELNARKEEFSRLPKLFAELQQKINDVVRKDEERSRQNIAFDEGRRQDNVRISTLQTETTEIRKRTDESRAKMEILEDLVRRNDARIGELTLAENDRRMSQMAWVESQSVISTDRDRAWNDLKARVDTILQNADDFSRRMDTYSETHRQMKKLIEEYYINVERIDRRINEAAEVQRLAEERFKQEWNAFLADEQKRWTTHMLLRDEQWRDHDRQAGKIEERVAVTEEQITDLLESIRAMVAHDQSRLQAIHNLVREQISEYERTMTKVR